MPYDKELESHYDRLAGSLNMRNPLRDGDKVKTSEGMVIVTNRGGYWQVRTPLDVILPGFERVDSMQELCYQLNRLEPA